MDVMEAIRSRRSVRAYRDAGVEEAKLQAVLEAARLAPSAKNRQEWRFVVVRDPETRQKLSAAANGQQFVAQAPVVIAACSTNGEYTMSCGNSAAQIDVAIAVDHMTLKAVEEGLGTCWIGAFQQDEAREILGLPKDANIVALLTLGYPAEEPPSKSRKILAQIVCHETWQ